MLSANENRLLFFGNCIACHGEFGKKSAPHLLEVKGYYLMKYPKKKDFVTHLSTWVANPNREEALLSKEIEKYKLMPYLAIDLETLQKIATYMYENDDFGGLK
jgi:hypothetical protein